MENEDFLMNESRVTNMQCGEARFCRAPACRAQVPQWGPFFFLTFSLWFPI